MRFAEVLTKQLNLYSLNLPFLHCLVFSVKKPVLQPKYLLSESKTDFSIKLLKINIFDTFCCKTQKDTFKIFCLPLWENDCYPSCFLSTTQSQYELLNYRWEFPCLAFFDSETSQHPPLAQTRIKPAPKGNVLYKRWLYLCINKAQNVTETGAVF